MATVETRPMLLTVPEVARLLRCSRHSVYRRIADGSIPAVRLGEEHGPLRVPSDELDHWLFGVAASRHDEGSAAGFVASSRSQGAGR
ncbi:MAG TPA: helix-turn-helix domain-containing protein [Gaiellaceae bacterium]|nr:helix-turn-helix domain-containing protein [Gaiellaceae bacterium]